MDALFYAVDGNFHANLKEKPYDKDDTPLSKGAAYFADEDAFAAFAAELGPLQPEVRPAQSQEIYADSVRSQAPATSSRRWDRGLDRTGAKCQGLWDCSARVTCLRSLGGMSICKRENGKRDAEACVGFH